MDRRACANVYTASPEPLLLTENLPDSNFDIFEFRKLRLLYNLARLFTARKREKNRENMYLYGILKQRRLRRVLKMHRLVSAFTAHI